MSEKLQRFTKLLRDMFELEKSDLDFGIYRISIRISNFKFFLTMSLYPFYRLLVGCHQPAFGLSLITI